jgi:hypothetical protein
VSRLDLEIVEGDWRLLGDLEFRVGNGVLLVDQEIPVVR